MNPKPVEQEAPEPKCRQCGGKMGQGYALRNTRSYGTPDFPGQKDLTGQTFSYTGPPVQVEVWKCEQCGHSVAAAPNPNNVRETKTRCQ